VRRLLLSSRSGPLDSIPAKPYSVGKLPPSIIELLGSITYYGSLSLFIAALVLTVSRGVDGFPVAGPGREPCQTSLMNPTEIEGGGPEIVKGCR